jgi:hypothetical protein
VHTRKRFRCDGFRKAGASPLRKTLVRIHGDSSPDLVSESLSAFLAIGCGEYARGCDTFKRTRKDGIVVSNHVCARRQKCTGETPAFASACAMDGMVMKPFKRIC